MICKWLPITTAPKDGTVIDVWVWSFELVSRDSDELRQSAGLRIAGVYWKNGCWRDKTGRNLHDTLMWFSECIAVTHWTQPPEAPNCDIQPIKTAPKDGSEICLISPWRQVVVAWWDGANWRYGEKPGEVWDYDYPTHWMRCSGTVAL